MEETQELSGASGEERRLEEMRLVTKRDIIMEKIGMLLWDSTKAKDKF